MKNITSAVYCFDKDELHVKAPFPVVKETEKLYHIAHGYHYNKMDEDKVILRSISRNPYLEVFMVDGTEEALREKLCQWFNEKAEEIGGKK